MPSGGQQREDEGAVVHVMAFFEKARVNGLEYEWWSYFLGGINENRRKKNFNIVEQAFLAAEEWDL